MSAYKPEIYAKLATLTGQEVDLDDLDTRTQKEWKRFDGDAMAVLAEVSNKLHITISPLQIKFHQALWKASEDCPLVIWSDAEEDWIVVTKAGLFSVRIVEGESPLERKTISHAALLKRIGLENSREYLKVGIVQLSLPMMRSSTASTFKSHEHEHHKEHMSPEKRYFKMLLEDKKDILTLLVFSVLSGLLYLTVPLAVENVVTYLGYGTQSKPYMQALLVIGQLVLGFLALQAVITGFQYYISDVIQRRIFARTTADIAYRLPRAKQCNFDQAHAPELVNRFLDVVTAQKNTAFFLLDGVNSLMATLVGMILLSLYHPFLLIFVIVLVLLIVVIVLFGGKGAVKTSIVESKTKYNMVNWFEEIALYPIMFKGSGGYELATSVANRLATDYVNARTAHFNIVIKQVTGLLILSVIASAALLLGGAWLVISQQITLGQLVASEIIMGSIIASLAKFGKKLEAWYDTMAATDKLGHLFDLELESEEGEVPLNIDESKGVALQAKDLCLSFPNQGNLIDNQNFEILPGEKVAVLGAYGSGVSALLDLTFKLRLPDQGYLLFDGIDVRNWKTRALRKQVLLLRSREILDSSIIDNIRLGRTDIGLDEIQHALRRVGLLDKFLQLPNGLNHELNLGGATLPKSQRISLLVARALVQTPRLLVIDELFDGLQEETFKVLSDIVFDPESKWTVLFATRNPEHSNLCKKIIRLSK